MKNVHFCISDELYNELKLHALVRNCTVTEYLVRLISSDCEVSSALCYEGLKRIEHKLDKLQWLGEK